MIILGLNSCGMNLSVALSHDGALLANSVDFTHSSQAERLTPMIEEILDRVNFNYTDIDYLALTTGPGSFTGVRVGIACASAIRLAMNMKMVGLSTLEIVAYKMIRQSRYFDFYVVILNASRKELYIQIFDKDNNAISEIELIKIEQIEDYIEKLDGLVAIGGSGLYNIGSFIEKNHMKYNVTYLPRFPYSEARTICKRAHELVIANTYNKSLDPIYIRKPDAKIGKNSILL